MRRYFNPRTPVGCDRCPWCWAPTRTDFNPRTPVGCDPWDCHHADPSHNFNPRTPVGCDLAATLALPTLSLFQSTHPSGVRLVTVPAVSFRLVISIHAPQWGATRQMDRRMAPLAISIHAPQWGATMPYAISVISAGISIHAPQWGAT